MINTVGDGTPKFVHHKIKKALMRPVRIRRRATDDLRLLRELLQAEARYDSTVRIALAQALRQTPLVLVLLQHQERLAYLDGEFVLERGYEDGYNDHKARQVRLCRGKPQLRGGRQALVQRGVRTDRLGAQGTGDRRGRVGVGG